MASPVRFAVVGLGDIAQRAVLPAVEQRGESGLHSRACCAPEAVLDGSRGRQELGS